MVDISSGDKKINITVTSSGNKASVNATPDMAMYYSNKSREWAISDKIVDNEDYSSKYYANISKQNADKSTATFENLTTNYNEYKTDLENTKNISVEEIETAKTNAISDITNQENLSVDNVNTAGATQVNLAKEQAEIATAKASEVVESGDNAITAITEQETTSKNNIETKGAEQITLIQNEGATQIANVQSTGFYMRDDKLYFINSQGEETEFKSGGSGLEVCDIGMALYVDESKGLRRYLNGQVITIDDHTTPFFNRLQEIVNLYPSLACTESEWQTAKTMSAFGQVGKFVIDEDNSTVRLPAIVNVQGLFDLSNLGMTVEAGLPNITGRFGIGDSSGTTASGAFYTVAAGRWNEGAGSNANNPDVVFDASRSSSIYGKSNTVQPEAIQYPYFIQIATGSETENNIINDIELNNPFSLFDSKYSDHELNNLSWLKSEGQWNAKAVYPTAYDKLLKVYNGTETVEGLSVKLSTETYTDYDFVLNTADETFRLPLLDGSEDLISDNYNSSSFSATNGGYVLPINKNGQISIRIYGSFASDVTVLKNNKAVGTFNLQSNIYRQGTITTQVVKGDKIKVITNASGITVTCNYLFFEAKGNGSLYYYVGETVQNANFINAGRIEEQLASIIPDNSSLIASYAMPSDKYINLALGASGSTYTAPANGWFVLYSYVDNKTARFLGYIELITPDNIISCGVFPLGGYGYFRGGGIICCPKDWKVRVMYENSVVIEYFRFVYAEGAE